MKSVFNRKTADDANCIFLKKRKIGLKQFGQ